MIKCINLSKSFNGRKVLEDITISIENSKITSLIGKNGAGKSTLIGALLEYYKADDGSIIKNSISVMPDADSLYMNVTGYEFLNFMSHLKGLPSNSEALSLAKKLQIDKELSKKISTYSFGMKKKISFIQSCIGVYDAYIFDEPTSGVDEPSAIMMLKIINRLKEKGRAILLTSHNLDELERVSDYIYLIEQGRIVNQGNVKDVLYQINKSTSHTYVLKTFNKLPDFGNLPQIEDIDILKKNDFEVVLVINSLEKLQVFLKYCLEQNVIITELSQPQITLREAVYN